MQLHLLCSLFLGEKNVMYVFICSCYASISDHQRGGYSGLWSKEGTHYRNFLNFKPYLYSV